MSKPTEEKGHMGGIRYKHPSMAFVSIHRQSSSPGMSLYGSSIKHQNVISLKIGKAEMERDLSTDWHFEGEPYIEVLLSPTQFAEMLTTMNVGGGTPATLSFLNGECYEAPDMPTKASQFRKEVEADLQEVVEELRQAQSMIDELLKDDKPIGKKGKADLSKLVNSFKGLVENHLPFVMNQFSKQMARTVAEAKGSVDAFVQHTVVTTGLKALQAPEIQEKGEGDPA